MPGPAGAHVSFASTEERPRSTLLEREEGACLTGAAHQRNEQPPASVESRPLGRLMQQLAGPSRDPNHDVRRHCRIAAS
jgi:hypothetical protein